MNRQSVCVEDGIPTAKKYINYARPHSCKYSGCDVQRLGVFRAYETLS